MEQKAKQQAGQIAELIAAGEALAKAIEWQDESEWSGWDRSIAAVLARWRQATTKLLSS